MLTELHFQRIRHEYNEPVKAVITGYRDMGHSQRSIARILEVSQCALRNWCRR